MFSTSPISFKQVILDGYILPSQSILGTAPKMLLLFTTAFCPAFKLAYYSIYVIPFCDYSTKVSTFECIYIDLVVTMLSLEVLMVLFGFDLDYFKKLISTITLLSIEIDSSAVRTIKRNRLSNRIMLVITFICRIIFRSINLLTNIRNLGKSRVIVLIFTEFFITFGLFFLLNMICNICVCLQVAFNQINSRIAALTETTKQLASSFEEIRNLRHNYSYAVRSTQHAEKLFRCFITLFYIEYFTYNIMNVVKLFGPRTKIDPIYFIYMFTQTLQLLILTYNLVLVNNLSRQGLEDLYEFSFKLNSLHLYHENDIFIARMALSDVGFTFANLFTINNSFITSLLTLSLTIILTLASFLYQ
uniref:Gustatory receptor n=1 Tax=Tetranychus urticae TaxID=32264 RepID=T1KPA5_TETUR